MHGQGMEMKLCNREAVQENPLTIIPGTILAVPDLGPRCHLVLLGPGAKVLSVLRFLSLAVPVSGLKVRVREGVLEHDWFYKVERKGTELEKEREEVVR